MKRRLTMILALVLAGGMRPDAQSPPPAGSQAPSFQVRTTAILVDVVVRDKDGRLVTDLKADDFEVYEDGVRQELGSFSLVSRGRGIGIGIKVKEPGTTTVVTPPSPADSAAPEPEPYPAVTALVFDALSADALALCQKAALEYLPMTGSFDLRVGVFATEPHLRALQGYTDDPALVRQAVRQLAAAGTSAQEAQRERRDILMERRKQVDQLASATTTATTTGSVAGAGAALGRVEMERRLVEGELRMLEAFETLDRDHRGYGTTNALLAVAQSLSVLPGRKTLVFFSEGLPASPALQANLQSAVEAANRANITVYAIDATGLRVRSTTEESRRTLEETGYERLRQVGAADAEIKGPITRMIERTEDMLRLDPQGGLARLAEDTGGFLIRDTNDLRSAFQRIDEDMRFHYLLTYSPKNPAFDGTYRKIAVKVTRPGVEVFARNGYRALPFAPSGPVLEYETRALAALERPKLPNGFPFSAVALNFPDPKRPGLSPVVVRLQTDALTYDEDPASRTYAAEAAIVVRFKNANGQVVHKTSQQYLLSGKLEEIDAARKGEILFYREPELEPGVYTVEVAVSDAAGERASARVATLEVRPPRPDRVALSSIVVVQKAERLSGAPEAEGGPLRVGDLLLYPNTGDPVSRSADRELTFFYTVYTGTLDEVPADAGVELRRNGRTLVSMPTKLDAPGEDGRIQQISRLPLGPLTPGTYELRVVIGEGEQQVSRSTFFRIVA